MITDLFSKREARRRGEGPDVYCYDRIPDALRVQIVQILHDTLGNAESYNDGYYGQQVRNAYERVVKLLRKEYGVFSLTGTPDTYLVYLKELTNFILLEQNTDRVIDGIMISFRAIDLFTRNWNYRHKNDASERANGAIEELNGRFREHGVGYQFVDGDIIRIDSELLHADIVKPALTLLRAPEYSSAQQEFLTAHKHYRHGRKEEALNECLKAFESVMKIICAKRRWALDPNATSKDLLKVLFDNGLIPPFWNAYFSGLRATLEAGVPTARNRLSGHGQGIEIREIPDHLVSYILHQTASAIVFLVEAEKTLV